VRKEGRGEMREGRMMRGSLTDGRSRWTDGINRWAA